MTSRYIDEFGRERERDDRPLESKRRRSLSREDSAERKRNRRSLSPSRRPQPGDGDSYVPNYDRTGYRRRSPPPEDRRPPSSDSYVPDYERDGYNPAPKHPEYLSHDPYGLPPHFGGPDSFRFREPERLDYMLPFGEYAKYLREKGIIKGRPNREGDDKEAQEYADQTQEIRKRYEIYKENFQHRQTRKFFEYHQEEEWAMERYHPFDMTKEERHSRIVELKKGLLTKWLNDLGAERFDNVCYDEPKIEDDGQSKVSEDDPDYRDKIDLARRTVFLRAAPNNVRRAQILELVQSQPGFQYLAISEPRQYQVNKPPPLQKADSKVPIHLDLLPRVAWIVFDSPEDAENAAKELDNKPVPTPDKTEYVLMTIYNSGQVNFRTRHVYDAFSSKERLLVDLQNAKAFVEKLDKTWDCANGGKALREKIETLLKHRQDARDISMEEDILSDIKLELDLYITYLRRVHLFCYYSGGIECDSWEELSRKAGDRLYRRLKRCTSDTVIADDPDLKEEDAEDVGLKDEKEKSEPNEKEENEKEKEKENEEKKVGEPSEDRFAEKMAQAMTRFDARLELKLNPPNLSDMSNYGGRDLDAELDKHLETFSQKISDAKFKCKVCEKLFKEEKYVKKHLTGKHPEKWKKLETEVLYFNAFIADPHHLVPRDAAMAPPQFLPPTFPPTISSLGPGFFSAPPNYVISGYPPNFIPYAIAPPQRGPSGYGHGRGGYAPVMAGGHGYVYAGGFDRGGKRFHPYGRKDDARGSRTGLLSMPTDPRQVKSYVDLDAPAAGDVQINYD